MSGMTGVAVVAPDALVDAAREVVAPFYLDPVQRGNVRIQLSADGSAPATHYAANWMVTSAEFQAALANVGSLPVDDYLALLPEEERADAQTRITTALASFLIYDPNNLFQSAPTVDTWDGTKINVLPLATGKWAEARDLLAPEGLVTVTAD